MKKLFLNVVLVSALFLSAAAKAETQPEYCGITSTVEEMNAFGTSTAKTAGGAAAAGVFSGVIGGGYIAATGTAGATSSIVIGATAGAIVGFAAGTIVGAAAGAAAYYVVACANLEEWAEDLQEYKNWYLLYP